MDIWVLLKRKRKNNIKSKSNKKPTGKLADGNEELGEKIFSFIIFLVFFLRFTEI